MSIDEHDLTQLAVGRWSTADSPRLAELLTSSSATSTRTPAR